MPSLAGEARYALRSLVRSPALSIAAVVSIGMGVGATTTVFSWLEALVLHPFPGVVQPDRVVGLEGAGPTGDGRPLSFPTFRDWRDQSRSFTAAAWTIVRVSVRETGDAASTPLLAMPVSGNYFAVLGGGLVVGRAVDVDDEQEKRPVVTLAYAYWMRRYAGDRSVVDRTLYLNGQPFRVVGIAGPDFVGTYVGVVPDMFVPITLQPLLTGINSLDDRSARIFQAVARLAPGVDLARLQTELDALARRISANAGERPITGAIVKDIRTQYLGGVVAPLFHALLAVTGLLLLVGCGNVAALLLVRGNARRHELAVRLALGGSRVHVASLVLFESIVLSACGAVLGLGVALLGRGLLERFMPTEGLPLTLPIDLSWRVFAFTLALSALVALLCASLPALRTMRVPGAEALRAGGRSVAAGRSRARDAVIAGQLTFSVVCLVTAGLFVTGLRSASAIELGFRDPDHVLLVTSTLAPTHTPDSAAANLIASIIERVGALPGVTAATVSTFAPLGLGGRPVSDLRVEGHAVEPNQDASAIHVSVGPAYAALMRTRVVEGRDIDERDLAGRLPVVVVNETLARRYWPHASPLGHRVDAGHGWATIVGVVQDGKYGSLTERPQAVALFPIAQWYQPAFTLYVRTSGNPRVLVEPVRRALQAVEIDIPSLQPRTLSEQISAATFVPRTGAAVLTSFGFAALALSIVGLYAVLALAVSLRRREIGIRITLGASPVSMAHLVVGHGATIASIGLAVGIALSVWTSRLMRARIPSMGALDVSLLAAVSALLAIAVLVAALVPARRATRVDPAVVLRAD